MQMRNVFAALLAAAAMVSAQGPRRAPGFSLTDIHGQFHDLIDYRGKYLILEFMKTDCPHCATFAGILSQVQQKYGDKVAILSVANIPTDNPNTIGQFIAGHKASYPIVMDQGQMEFSYVLAPTTDLPRCYIIDPSGFIRADYGYSLTTRDIFEGRGLMNELDRLLGSGAAGKK